MHHGPDFNVARRHDGDVAVVAPRGEPDLAGINGRLNLVDEPPEADRGGRPDAI